PSRQSLYAYPLECSPAASDHSLDLVTEPSMRLNAPYRLPVRQFPSIRYLMVLLLLSFLLSHQGQWSRLAHAFHHQPFLSLCSIWNTHMLLFPMLAPTIRLMESTTIFSLISFSAYRNVLPYHYSPFPLYLCNMPYDIIV